MTPREHLHTIRLLKGSFANDDICRAYDFDRIDFDAKAPSGLVITAYCGRRQASRLVTPLEVLSANEAEMFCYDVFDALKADLVVAAALPT